MGRSRGKTKENTSFTIDKKELASFDKALDKLDLTRSNVVENLIGDFMLGIKEMINIIEKERNDHRSDGKPYCGPCALFDAKNNEFEAGNQKKYEEVCGEPYSIKKAMATVNGLRVHERTPARYKCEEGHNVNMSYYPEDFEIFAGKFANRSELTTEDYREALKIKGKK